MLRRYVSTAFLSGSLLFGSLFLAPSLSTLLAKAVGAFATVIAIDSRRMGEKCSSYRRTAPGKSA